MKNKMKIYGAKSLDKLFDANDEIANSFGELDDCIMEEFGMEGEVLGVGTFNDEIIWCIKLDDDRVVYGNEMAMCELDAWDGAQDIDAFVEKMDAKLNK